MLLYCTMSHAETMLESSLVHKDSYKDALSVRQLAVARNATLSYDEPVLMARAEGATMFDETGKEWLDCANNVAHVGHSEPSVRNHWSDMRESLNLPLGVRWDCLDLLLRALALHRSATMHVRNTMRHTPFACDRCAQQSSKHARLA